MGKILNLNGVLVGDEYKDPRDYNISQFIPGEDIVTDEEFMLKFPKTQIIINQGNINACVGHSFIMAKKIIEYQYTNKWIDFDPFILYGTRYSGEYQGTGMIPGQGAKALLKDGAFFRRDFNLKQEMPQLKETVEEWKEKNPDKVKAALDYRISGYSYVQSTNDIKKSLKNKMPVSVAYPIYESFYETKEDGKVKIPNTSTEKKFGYHQMLIVGWTKNNEWIVLNSWGINYGVKGVYLIPFSFRFDSAISVSDNITPCTHKAERIIFKLGCKDFNVDGVNKEFDVIPYIKNNRTYVSVRFITEALGCSVQWNSYDKEITVRSEEAIITLKIGSKFINCNGQNILMDVTPEIIDNRTMLPARYICQLLNCEVLWSDEDKTISISAL